MLAPLRLPDGGRTGVWRSLVARFVRDEEVVGSNPATPTKARPIKVSQSGGARWRAGRCRRGDTCRVHALRQASRFGDLAAASRSGPPQRAVSRSEHRQVPGTRVLAGRGEISVTQSLGYVAIYVALAGVASFIEMPAGRGFGAFQLNALIRTGSLAAAAVALVFGHGLAFPAAKYLLGGMGIGLLSGVGSMLYCFGLDYLPVSLVVTFSNLYIVITVVLGVVVLHEPVTVLKIAGLLCIMAGVLVLARSPARHAANPEASSAGTPPQPRGFAIMGIYVAVIGSAPSLRSRR